MINKILITCGAFSLFIALFLFQSFKKQELNEFGILPKHIKYINIIFHLLILFFFIGYCFIFIQVYKMPQSKLTSMLSQILFWGAIFVVITIYFLKIMLDNIIKAKLNQIDALTNLNNKISGQCKIKELLATHNKEVFIAILDLDNFKKINDIYGHLIGDETLIKIANIIQKTIKEQDISCRFGGDEFVICFLSKNKNQVKLIIEKIINEISIFAKDYKEANLGISVGIAFGIGKKNNSNITYNRLMKNADKALYHIKKNGKNSYHFYSQENETILKPTVK